MQEEHSPLEAAIQDLMARKSEMVSRFFDVATRQVARKDEYGMERWRDLPKLIHGCISRLGEADGFEVHLVAPRSYKNGSIVGLSIVQPGSEFAWQAGATMDSYELLLPDNDTLNVKRTEIGAFEVSRRRNGLRTTLGEAKDLLTAIALAEDYVPSDAIHILKNDASWRGLPPTEAQLSLLKRQYPAEFVQMAAKTYTRGEVSRLLSVRQRDATWPITELQIEQFRYNLTRLHVPGQTLYTVLFGRLEAAFKTHYSSIGRDSLDADNTQSFSGTQFELRIASMLEKCGCQCEMTPATGDQGADLIVHYRGRKIAVQVKRRSGTVGNSAVQEVIASRKLYHCNEAWVVTNSRFTKSAREVASAHDIVLVEGTELDRFQSILDSDVYPTKRTLFDG